MNYSHDDRFEPTTLEEPETCRGCGRNIDPGAAVLETVTYLKSRPKNSKGYRAADPDTWWQPAGTEHHPWHEDCARLTKLQYPGYDAPLIQAFGGAYESGFVLLHPFIEWPQGIEPTENENLSQEAFDELVLEKSNKCTWAWVADRCGLKTYSYMERAIMNSGAHFVKEKELTTALDPVVWGGTDLPDIELPDGGQFATLLTPDIIAAFVASKAKEVVYIPEFVGMDPIERIALSEFVPRKDSYFPYRGTVTPLNNSFLFTVDWESPFTLFYGKRDFVESIVMERDLEGFFLEPHHQRWWQQDVRVTRAANDSS